MQDHSIKYMYKLMSSLGQLQTVSYTDLAKPKSGAPGPGCAKPAS